jgi:hypothetical protein
MEWRRGEDLRGEFKRVERGWCLGGEEFRQELLEQVEARPGPSHLGEAVQEAEAAQAERLVVAGLKRMRWSEADLRACLKKTIETRCGRFGVPPLGGFCAAPPKGGTPNRVFKQALRARRKGERGKVQLARELRSKTTMPLAWIAARLNMGSRGHLVWLLQQRGSGRLAAPRDQCLLGI